MNYNVNIKRKLLDTQLESSRLELLPEDNHRLAEVCGQCDEHLRQIEQRLGVEISSRGNVFQIIGYKKPVRVAERIIQSLYADAETLGNLDPNQVHLYLQEQSNDLVENKESAEACEYDDGLVIHTRKLQIKPRGKNQSYYIQNINNYDINFGVGPAGTGKTYLAVACAARALEMGKVKRILLTRPAVEAGENLGFLPGDLAQKVDPYLRPLYDALYEMLGIEQVDKLISRNIIEVAPLAYMRGRTLNDAFVILDESQNTTAEQMKMFLTRIGFGTQAVITGDITQVDLPRGKMSGLKHAIEVLSDVAGISFTFLRARDVVRHPLVQRVVEAYDNHGAERDD
ncbi:PhoH-like protein [Piscirickettsia salmonis]|nr:AAA domain protein [Piscirickettsia salmonis]QGN78201.1 PhoH-like protein [Piscirickettsia salmonis]QGN81781.1 PhoH-like protein [Piscirickettsia salmonis]QGN83946.1 PhoH-like protein [Piscirickettsia salmonis]QGN87457.1 PhoH-like protein [Piscirickettsia salmonis]